MKLELLRDCARGTKHYTNTKFLWYNGLKIEGRIVGWASNDGPIDRDRFFLMPWNKYDPTDPTKQNLDYCASHGKEIKHESSVELDFSCNSFEYHDDGPYVSRDNKFKKMIIIGAGASFDFDSANISKVQFPITKKLFSAENNGEQILFNGVTSLANDLNNTSNLEEYFQREWERLCHVYNPKRMSDLISVQYYLQNLFFVRSSKVRNYAYSNYSSLVNSISNWSDNAKNEKMAIVNYNYDLLLDYQLRKEFNSSYSKLDDFIDINNRPIALFKPHGSVNWVRRFKNDFIEELMTSNRQDEQPTSILSFVQQIYEKRISMADILNSLNEHTEIAHEEEAKLSEHKMSNVIVPENLVMTSRPYFPQMLMPHSKKDEFLMPKSHISMLRRAIQEIDEILIIGWKGEEAGIHELFKELCDREVKVTVVGNVYNTIQEHKIDGVAQKVESKAPKFNCETMPVVRTLSTFLPKASWKCEPIGFSGYAKKMSDGKAEFFNS